MKHFLILSIIMIFFSCGKEVTILPQEDVLSKEELEQQQKEYFDKLVQINEGWFFNLAGAEEKDSVMLHLIFKQDGKVLVKATTRENLKLNESQFSIYGDYRSILKFEGNSIFSLLNRISDAPQQFIIQDFSTNTAYLKRADGYNNNLYSLKPFNDRLNDLFLAKQDSVYGVLDYESAFAVTKALFTDMILDNVENDNTKKRFNVFSFEETGFHWSNVDTITNEITFEFVPPYNSSIPTFVKYQKTYSYDYFPGGMTFSPNISYGDVWIDSIFFENYDNIKKVLNVTQAGNIKDVLFGYSNQEAHYYEGLTNLFSKDFCTPASPAHTLSTPQPLGYFKGRFADLASVARIALNKDLANSQLTVILRINNTGSGGGSMIQIYSNAGNIMFRCDFETSGKNVLKIKNLGPTTGTPAANYTPEKIQTARQFLIDTFGNESGFYIHPKFEKVTISNVSYHSISILDRNNSDDYIDLYIGNNTGSPSLSTYYERYTK